MSLAWERMGIIDRELPTWQAALERTRHLVVLGEAGSGKSWELEALAERLTNAGRPAFFLRLEDVYDDAASVVSAINVPSKDDFVLALDSVDEARLKGNRPLERCLSTLGQALSAAWPRARLVISCRVSDWRVGAEGAALDRLLPPGGPAPPAAPNFGVVRTPTAGEPHRTRVMCLAPLDGERTLRLARARGVQDPDGFMNELGHSGAAQLCGRPQDVVAQVAHWNAHRTLGTLGQVVEADVGRKLEQPDDRREPEPLTPAEARAGAEELAAALVLGRSAWLVVPDEHAGSSSGAIDPVSVLPTWSRAKVRTLLSRPIFDEATLGRVRFHHRRTREYLAARWLARLAPRHGARRIEAVLAGTVMGAEVLHPATAQVSSWLASFDPSFAELILRLHPFLLLQQGDPQALALPLKERLLHAAAESYRQKSHRWPQAQDWEMLGRFAHEDLTPTVRSLLLAATNDDLRLQLLRLAAAGRLAGCADVGLNLAIAEGDDVWVRCTAVDLVADAGSDDQRTALVGYFTAAATIDRRVLLRLWRALFPSRIDVAALIESVRRHCTTVDEERALEADSAFETWLVPACPAADLPELLAGLLGLLRGERGEAGRPWLLGPTCTALLRLLREPSPAGLPLPVSVEVLALAQRLLRADPDLRALVRRPTITRDLAEATMGHATVREALFWHQVGDDERLSLYHHLCTPELIDLDWLLEGLSRDDRQARVALQAAFVATASHPDAVERVRRAVSGRPILEQEFQRLLAPPAPGRFELEDRRLREEAEARRQQIIERIRSGRGSLAAGTDENGLIELTWRFVDQSRMDWPRLEQEYGAEVVHAVREGTAVLWRRLDPPERHAFENRMPGVVIPCLVGLDLFFERWRPGDGLSVDVATRAARFALWENATPAWLSSVTSAHLLPVRDIFLAAIERDFVGPFDHRTLSMVASGPETLLNACSTRIGDLLALHEPPAVVTLEWALRILLERASDRPRVALLAAVRAPAAAAAAELAESRQAAAKKPEEVQTHRAAAVEQRHRHDLWVWAWLGAEASSALDYLERQFGQVRSPGGTSGVVALLANARTTVFPRPGLQRREMPLLSLLRPSNLERFLRLVHVHLPPEEDDGREEAHTPSRREESQSTRSMLTQLLGSQDTEEAYRALLGLARGITSQGTVEWLQEMAVNVAARVSQGPAWSPARVAEFSARGQAAPRTSTDLFRLVLDRLDDIGADLERGRFSARGLFRADSKEIVIQKWLAGELHQRSAGHYTVHREEEVDQGKMPDIEVHSPTVQGPVCVEIKPAGSYSYSELQEALTRQLVQQYLRDRRSNHGVLFLGNLTPGRTWQPSPADRLSFQQLVERLDAFAQHIVGATSGVQGLRVVGVELLDPPGVPINASGSPTARCRRCQSTEEVTEVEVSSGVREFRCAHCR